MLGRMCITQLATLSNPEVTAPRLKQLTDASCNALCAHTCTHTRHRRAADSAAWNYAQQRYFALAYARFVTARAVLLLQNNAAVKHHVAANGCCGETRTLAQPLAPELPVPSVVLALSTELISCSELVAALQAVNAAAGEQLRCSSTDAGDSNNSSSSSGVGSNQPLLRPVGPAYPFVAV
jgi:hypothetical protein